MYGSYVPLTMGSAAVILCPTYAADWIAKHEFQLLSLVECFALATRTGSLSYIPNVLRSNYGLWWKVHRARFPQTVAALGWSEDQNIATEINSAARDPLYPPHTNQVSGRLEFQLVQGRANVHNTDIPLAMWSTNRLITKRDVCSRNVYGSRYAHAAMSHKLQTKDAT